MNTNYNYNTAKLDHKAILDIVQNGSSVLDLGCGEGDLLYLLVKEKQVKAQGVDIDEQAIYKCVEKGLSVFHGDIDSGLADYNDKSFDYVILNQSLQQVRNLENALEDALRVGQKVIVGVPNFAHYKARYQMFFKGRAPITHALPYQWYNTPNLHFLSLADFTDYCAVKAIKIESSTFVGDKGRIKILPNVFAQIGIFVVSKADNLKNRRVTK
jgi:methionine biosynthesis protein MetW